VAKYKAFAAVRWDGFSHGPSPIIFWRGLGTFKAHVDFEAHSMLSSMDAPAE
jgi:hypothetical protein